MVEITTVEEKNVKNVSITGNKVSIYGDVVRDANGILTQFTGKVQDNENAEVYVGDVYYTVNNASDRKMVTSYVNVQPDYYVDSLDLFSEAIKQILTQEA